LFLLYIEKIEITKCGKKKICVLDVYVL